MNAAQRATMDWAKSNHAQLDAEDTARDLLGDSWFPTPPKSTRLPTLHGMQAMGYHPPQQYRLTIWTQYRRWLWNGLRSGSFAAVAMGGFVLGMYTAILIGAK